MTVSASRESGRADLHGIGMLLLLLGLEHGREGVLRQLGRIQLHPWADPAIAGGQHGGRPTAESQAAQLDMAHGCQNFHKNLQDHALDKQSLDFMYSTYDTHSKCEDNEPAKWIHYRATDLAKSGSS